MPTKLKALISGNEANILVKHVSVTIEKYMVKNLLRCLKKVLIGEKIRL